MENMSERLERLEKNPAFQRLQQEEKEKIRAERQQAAQEIERIKTESSEILEQIQADRETAAAELQEAEKELKAKKETLARLDHEIYTERHRADREINQNQQKLLTSYDPAIDQAIDFFRDEFERIRKTNTSWQTHQDGIDMIGFKKKLVSYSNKNSILRALKYCREAIQGLEAAKLDPDFDPARIEAVKLGIPDPGELEEFKGDKPLKDAADVSPMMQLKSDSQLEWEMNKLDQKFKKVMTQPTKQKGKNTLKNVIFDGLNAFIPKKPQPDPAKKKAGLQAMREAKQKLEATR